MSKPDDPELSATLPPAASRADPRVAETLVSSETATIKPKNPAMGQVVVQCERVPRA